MEWLHKIIPSLQRLYRYNIILSYNNIHPYQYFTAGPMFWVLKYFYVIRGQLYKWVGLRFNYSAIDCIDYIYVLWSITSVSVNIMCYCAVYGLHVWLFIVYILLKSDLLIGQYSPTTEKVFID